MGQRTALFQGNITSGSQSSLRRPSGYSSGKLQPITGGQTAAQQPIRVESSSVLGLGGKYINNTRRRSVSNNCLSLDHVSSYVPTPGWRAIQGPEAPRARM